MTAMTHSCSKLRPSWLLLSGLLLLAPSAFAQDEGEETEKPDEGAEKKPPLKKNPPFINGRNIPVPGTIPTLKAQPLKDGKGPTRLPPKPNTLGSPPPPAPPPIPNIGANSGGKKEGGDEESFANLKTAGSKNCKPLKGSDRVVFDFKGDILELVGAISKVTCKNFILTNKVRTQKFEILSPSPITVDEAWRAFLSALEANEFSLIQVGRYYKIIQAADGVRAPVPMFSPGNEAPVDDRMVTVIWKPQHSGDVNALVNYLNIFKSNKGQIHPYPATGIIIATDFGTSIERLKRIFEEIDQPGALEQVHVVPVEFAGAQEIAEKLTQVFEPQKAAAAPGGKPNSRIKMAPQAVPAGESVTAPPTQPGAEGGEEEGVVAVSKILADERTNKLIIIASDRAFKQIMALMRELDVPEMNGDGQIHVLRLKHANAEELSSTLASLAQGKPTTPKAPKPAAKAPGAAGAAAAAGGASASLFEGEVKVTADKSTNSLVITASKADLTSMRRVIEKLDVPRYQVFVEAVIMEVAVKNDRQVGVGWHGGVPWEIDGQQTPIIFANTPTRELSSLIGTTSPLSLASLLGLAGAFRGPDLQGIEELPGGITIPSVGVVLQALQSTNDVNIVSTPHLLTMDNEDAEIQVNEKRPFPSGLTLGGLGGLAGLAGGAAGGQAGGLGNLAGLGLGAVNFNREDIGLTLKLKPQINDEDYVKLEIDQELSDVAGTDQVTGQVITSKRAAKTTVVVRSQDSVVIGGLVRDRETISESKMPLLGDLPLLGWLFKRQAKAVEKVNLLLVLTPYIIRGPADFRTIFERKMEERKEFANRYFGGSGDYEPAIDWKRKMGPLATYRQSMRKELNRAENEGPGGEDEVIIRDGKPENKVIGPVPSQGISEPPPPPLDTPAVPDQVIPETPPVEP